MTYWFMVTAEGADRARYRWFGSLATEAPSLKDIQEWDSWGTREYNQRVTVTGFFVLSEGPADAD